MRAYWMQPDLTASKINGPWLRTGDLGYLDHDGLLWLTGRVDDIINRGGEKILPAHVESKIANLPEVAARDSDTAKPSSMWRPGPCHYRASPCSTPNIPPRPSAGGTPLSPGPPAENDHP
ncbi:MAG: hypothetical protein AAGC80_19210 [Rhodococcus sp. (in: high G+C Gram-positive bacteria)]